jgi:Flp pilus assembly protein TadD
MDGTARKGYPTIGGATLILLVVVMAAGCAASGPAQKSARMEVQDQVGFVITEEARISATARAEYEEAMRLMSLERKAEGMALLVQAAEEAPQIAAPRIDLGIAHHRAGDLAAAEEQLRKALEINPDHPVAYNELGIVYRKSGRFADARRSYEAALAIYPGFHFARRNLAILCDLYLSDMECALEQYGAYARTAPDDEEAAMWLADVRNRMAQ